MTERRCLTLLGPNGAYAVDAEIATEPPWSLRLDLGEGGIVEAVVADLFAALDAVRLQLEPVRILVCCQGARPNVFPSGMSRQMTGGRRAYELMPGQIPSRDDLVDIFDPADCKDVVTVEQQLKSVERIRG